MESDQEERKSRSKSVASDKQEGKDHNISHEDLSDVSDLDSVGPEDTEKGSKVCIVSYYIFDFLLYFHSFIT